MIVAVSQPGPEAMVGAEGEGSGAVRERVIQARDLMSARLGNGRVNAGADRGEVARFDLDVSARRLLIEAGRSQRLSGRSHDRVLRLARTVADLDRSPVVREEHLGGALQLRRRGGS
jgi:magnesium chelatase family protein